MPGYAATDLFSLGSNFSVQTSSTPRSAERAEALASDGDVACESGLFNAIQEARASYKHCGTSDTLAADWATDVGTAGALGDVIGIYILTEATVTLNYKDLPMIELVGHAHMDVDATVGDDWTEHADNHSGSERTFDITGLIPAQQGQGIPGTIFSSNDAISISSSGTITEVVFSYSCQHMDTEASDGDHFDGENRTCRVEARISGFGSVSMLSIGSNWKWDEDENSDSNTESDAFTMTVHQYVDAS